ncbi:amino acid adenylation domain-containing protein [Duganella sp. LX20W]|uniref:Amino acid adenylation domain-containing protein n=1 Tax=Rugamonas brunnea TaxID=2758569 RepID=A0A7W2ENJ6_9BURK|nr:non-ribosomal peptide synthetase [Rugamonas brunnea]MBA5635776.1 amino acid adenylation domain-containing protein [Rugamonas brunnea]
MQSIESLGQLKVLAARRPREASFWKAQIAALPGKSRFPADHGCGGAQLSQQYRAALAAATGAALERATSAQPLSQQVLLNAVVAALLERYTGVAGVAIGQPALRTGADQPLLAEWLPLALTLAPGASLRDLLAASQQQTQATLEHQDFPLQLLAHGDADDALHPFFDIGVRVLHAGTPAGAAPDGVSLLVTLLRGDDGYTWQLDYDGRQYLEETVERLARHLGLLLHAALQAPDAALGALSLLTDDDDRILAEANATAFPYEHQLRLDQVLARQVAQTPDAIAVTFGDRSLTYREFNARANQLAHTLRRHGVGRDQIVAVLAERSIEMLVAIHAVLKAGAAYLPIDPSYPQARVEYVLGDSGAPVILAHTRLVPTLATQPVIIDLDDPASYDADDTAPVHGGNARDVAYVIYTSGSTGNPKGVLVEHHSAINRIAWMQRAYPITAGDVILQKTPIAFDVSVWELFWWSFVGASVCLLAPRGERDPDTIIDTVERRRVTVMHFVPSMLNAFLDYVGALGCGARLRGLRLVFASGEALGTHQVEKFHAVLAPAQLINLYGPTEATVDVSHHLCRPDAGATSVPIGKPIDNLRLYVLDARMQVQAVGVPGELCIAGVGLARGYHRRPELTAERFVEHPFPGETRIYRTGDLARWNSRGEIEYLGRIDNQVKIRGYRIELGEIEARLREHPDVADAVAMAQKDADQVAELCAYVVAPAGTDVAALKRHLASGMPEYMVPAHIICMASFPLSPNGKLDRAALPKPSLAAGPAADYVAPRNATEQALAEIWSEVLAQPRVGVHDNFFALGGNSIHFVAVLAKARQRGLPFTFQQLFAHPTIAGLAEAISTAPAPAAEVAVAPFGLVSEADRARLPASAEDAYPLSLLQIGLVFQNELTFGTSQYHDILSYMIQSRLDVAAFEQAAAIVVARNPIFRTSYHLSGFDDPLQIVHRDAKVPPVIVDLRDLDGEGQEAWYQDWTETEKQRRFVWEEPGLVRLHVHILADDLYRYTLIQHNSALDGWSITLVHTQLFETYHAIVAGTWQQRAPVDNFLHHYVALERQSLATAADRDFWQAEITGATYTELPRCGAVQTGVAHPTVVFHDVDISRRLSERIVALSDRLGVPVKTLLMAVHLKVLSVLCGTEYAMTGYEQSGRPEHEDATEALGLFLNTVPFGLHVSAGSWEQLIRHVFDAERRLLPHRRYPMAQMMQDLDIRGMLFETAFNYTHFYRLKELRALPEFSLLDVRANSETEFVIRAEFSRHFYSDEVRLSLHYHDHVFTIDQMEMMGGYYRRAFELMTADPTQPHDLQSLLSPAETARLAEAGQRAAPAGVDAGVAVCVLDASGMPAPTGAWGQLHLAGAKPVATGRSARWLPDLRLECADGAPVPRIFGADTAKAARAPLPASAQPAQLTPWEQRIATVWAQVLRVDGASLRPEHDFFALGGNSLSAIRAVFMLEGAIRLADIMQHPTLAELAVIAAGGAGRAARMLVKLTGGAGDRATLVCLPYAGGGSASFRPLGMALREAGCPVGVYGVELPGHELSSQASELVDIPAAAHRLHQEIGATVTTPVILWGHCIGAALALALAQLMEQAGQPPLHVFIGGKLLHPAEQMHAGIAAIADMSDRAVVDWMVRETGHTELADFSNEHAAQLVALFRHDAAVANRYLAERADDDADAAGQPLHGALSVVVAPDDPLTRNYAHNWRNWSVFSHQLQLHELDGGGHYFCRTRPADVAALIAAVVTGVQRGLPADSEGDLDVAN